jgi:hypothetical protein
VRRDRDSRPLDDYGLEDEYDDDDPNNPSHRDYDLSESAPYEFDSWTSGDRPWFLRRWVLLTVSLLVVLSLVFSLILPHLV